MGATGAGALGLQDCLFVAGAVALQVNSHGQAGNMGGMGFNMHGQGCCAAA